jgi:hypothetical protein
MNMYDVTAATTVKATTDPTTLAIAPMPSAWLCAGGGALDEVVGPVTSRVGVLAVTENFSPSTDRSWGGPDITGSLAVAAPVFLPPIAIKIGTGTIYVVRLGSYSAQITSSEFSRPRFMLWVPYIG